MKRKVFGAAMFVLVAVCLMVFAENLVPEADRLAINQRLEEAGRAPGR